MNIDKQIEFDRIKEIWKEKTITDYAKEKIDSTDIILSEIDLRKQLKDTSDARQIIEKCGTPPLQNVSEILDIIEAAKKGECLTPYYLERVSTFLVLVRRLKDYLSRAKTCENPLAYYDENLVENEELLDEITRQIRNGGVDDYASKELFQIRTRITKCEEEMKAKADQIMRSNKDCMADNFSTIRNGRICLPVKRDCKFKIPGNVIDKSGTGSTLFIEPVSVAKLSEEIQLYKISEENEVYRILYTLTAMVSDSYDSFFENVRMVEKLDFIFSKGKLSIDMDAVEPSINTERKIELKNAWHPLMDKCVAVPLQFKIGGDVQGIVITGPNTGGKTVAIKTVMLNSIMAQCGLHVTCKEADICMNNAYLCDIGDGQNLSENLSTFSAHIKNVLSVLKEANANSFVIMDELGSGTDPTEGMGIAIAILEQLRNSGSLFLVTTHYPDVKEYASNTDHIINARMTFDKETLCPTYQMVIGEAGESCAFYIAQRLGMPGDMLKTAISAAYGKEAVSKYNFDTTESVVKKDSGKKITKDGSKKGIAVITAKFTRGDSVMVLPDKKIGIVCTPVNEKGVLQVQLQKKKIWINHKRVKLIVAATELYPDDYDFSIIFESVENRKKLHDMQRKLTDEIVVYDNPDL